jgi:hypothetical protein
VLIDDLPVILIEVVGIKQFEALEGIGQFRKKSANSRRVPIVANFQSMAHLYHSRPLHRYDGLKEDLVINEKHQHPPR